MNVNKRLLTSSAAVVLLVLAIAATCIGCTEIPNTEEATFEGFYKKNGEEITDKSMVFESNKPIYKFSFRDGESKLLKIHNKQDEILKDSSKILTKDTEYVTQKKPSETPAEDGAYVAQNKLKVGQAYDLQIENETIVDLEPVQQTQNVRNGVVSYTPGKHTLKNFLTTAVAPMGTLMVVGGGWDLQDVGAGNESRTIGVDSVWKDEFNNQTADYDWQNTYPHNGWNKDHFRGFDASGYLGWVLYNTMYDTNLEYPGLVFSPKKLIKTLTEEYDFGESVDLTGMSFSQIAKEFKPGDIVALEQHLYIIIGVCDDGSIVTAQCATAMSKAGVCGGGVQLSVLNPKNDLNENCEAFRLVDKYTKKVCPDWTKRYDTAVKMNEYYLDVKGIARMDLDDGMFTDPDNYASKKPAEILADIFD